MGVQHINDTSPMDVLRGDAYVNEDHDDMKKHHEEKLLHNIISVYDDSTLLKTIREEQQKCEDTEYQRLVTTATSGDSIFQFRDGVLCRLTNDIFTPVIPPRQELIDTILSQLHSSALGGHLSEKKLLQKVKRRFFWTTMRQDVNRFCKECPICQQQRSST